MKLSTFIQSSNNKKHLMPLTDFLNHAVQAGHDVNNNLEYWINEYSEFINEYEKYSNS